MKDINDMINNIINKDDNPKNVEEILEDKLPSKTHLESIFKPSDDTNIQSHIQTLIRPVSTPNSTITQTNLIDGVDDDWKELFNSYVRMKGIRLNEEERDDFDYRIKRIKSKITDHTGKRLNLHKSDFIYYADRCSSHQEVMKCLDISRDTYYKYMNKFIYPVSPQVRSILIEGTKQYKDKIKKGENPHVLSLREYYSIKWHGYLNIFDVKMYVNEYEDGDHYSGPKTYDGMIKLYFPEYLKERKEELKQLYNEGDWDKLNDVEVVGTYEILKRQHMKDVFTGKNEGSSWKKVQQWVMDYDILPKQCNSCGFDNKTTDERSGETIYPLVLNFINGNEKDCKLTNLELLCYNCHFIKYPYDNNNHWKYRWKPMSKSDMVQRSVKLASLKENMYRRNKWIHEMSSRLYSTDFINLEMKWNDTVDYDENGLGMKHPELDRLARKMMNDMYYYQ